MIRGPHGPRMLCSSAKQRICPNAHPNLYLSRTLSVDTRVNRTDGYERSEPLEMLAAGLSVDELPLFGEAVDNKNYRS